MRAEGSVLRTGHADTVRIVRRRGGRVDGEVKGWWRGFKGRRESESVIDGVVGVVVGDEVWW